jgi:hypothetical protein
MKLTWFGGTTLRMHIGGRILLADPAGISGVSEAELVSGADIVFRLRDALPELRPEDWRPRRSMPVLNERGPSDVALYRAAPGAVLVDAVGEPPLVMATAPLWLQARWTSEAAVVVFGSSTADVPEIAASVLDAMVPRLIAVAAPEGAVDAVIAAIGDRLEGTGLFALEPGMALEV